MNAMSAAVACGTFCGAASTTRLAWPGAPGCTTGGACLTAQLPHADTAPDTTTARGTSTTTKTFMTSASGNPTVHGVPSPAMLETPASVVSADLAPAPPEAPGWSLATRVAFRFCFLYFGLYVLTDATGWMKGLVVWTATHVFHVQYQYVTTQTTGSGDKTVDWIHAFLDRK